MSLPVASAPVAVLVLAWDEAAPAARVLVAAPETPEPAPNSVAVLVPAGPATDELTQEEFLPLEASLELLTPAPLPEPAPETPVTSVPEEADTAPTTSYPAPTATLPIAAEAAPAESAAPTLPMQEATAATAAALVNPALVWKEVRVLNLGSFLAGTPAGSLGLGQPTLSWQGAPSLPAAPYLGSSTPGPVALVSAATTSLPVAGGQATPSTVAAALKALSILALPSSGPFLPLGEVPVSEPAPVYLTAEPPAVPDAEPDATPALTVGEPTPSTDASTTEMSEEAAEPTEDFTVDVSPVQTTSTTPPALAETPAPPETELPVPTGADTAVPDWAGLHPAAKPFEAPDLNFQIIQYARLAVPQALAEQPFGVIYAPAWPTWLAAQELRQRTGQPLVLHLAQLAAADEPIALAAGWVAELQRQALHRADLILTETPALAQRLRHELALPAHRVRSVPAAEAAAIAQALCTMERG